MDIYSGVLIATENLPTQRLWPEVRQTLASAAAKKPRNWRLPAVLCCAVGGDITASIAGSAAIACAEASIRLLDDMLDEEPDGEYCRVGMPSVANRATALQAMAIEAILNAESDGRVKVLATAQLTQMLHTVAWGQYLDERALCDEPSYWEVARAKSGSFFSTAFYLGALLGGTSEQIAKQVGQLGQTYGEMMQIHDDLRDSLLPLAGNDWVPHHSTLPILYAELVPHPERDRFIALRAVAAYDPVARAEAQRILIRSGAISYGIHHLLLRQQQIQTILNDLRLVHTADLSKLLDDLMAPVWGLFKEANVDPSELALLLQYAQVA